MNICHTRSFRKQGCTVNEINSSCFGGGNGCKMIEMQIGQWTVQWKTDLSNKCFTPTYKWSKVQGIH